MSTTRTVVSSLRLAPFIAALAGLAACGSGPSESEIDAAVKKQVASEKAAAEKMVTGGASFSMQVHAVKKLGCNEASSAVFACDVEIDATPPGGARTKIPTTIRLAKGSDGWVPMR